jgi:hypothetical protein
MTPGEWSAATDDVDARAIAREVLRESLADDAPVMACQDAPEALGPHSR